jgi:beta-lactamase class D
MTTMKPSILLLLLTVGLASCSQAPFPPPEVTLLDVPAANGSMAPNIATGPDGTVVMSWIEPAADGHSLRFSVLEENGWSSPREVARGDSWFVNWADFPSVVPLSDDLWAAHWLASQPDGGYAYDVNVTMSNDRGMTWSAPFLPHFDGTPTEHGFVTLYPDSNGVGLVWLDGRKMINEYDENDVAASGMTLRGATFGQDQTPIRSALVDDLTCDCCQTDVALTSEGPVVVYRDRTVDEVRDIYVSRREFGEWQPGVAVARDDWEIPACPVNGPIVRANGDVVVVAWFTAANDNPTVKAAWSKDGGRTFEAPIVVSDETPLGHVGAELLPDGDLVVSWHRRAGAGGASLMLRRVSPTGARSAPYLLREAADVFAFSVPQLARRGEQAVVAWTNSVDDTYSVGSATVPVAVLGAMTNESLESDAANPLSAVFEEKQIDATMIVESLDDSRQFVHNAARASRQMSPASTFKVPNTLIALDRGVVTSKESVFTWDGTDRGVPQWNRDQTLESALRVSCVWCYQQIARQVGADVYEQALAALDYGNQDIGETVDQFWLNGDLQISAREQIDFLRRMLRYDLPYSRAHVDLVKDIMLVESTGSYALHAKSGWTGASLAVGWYIGFVTTAEGTWIFAMNMRLDNAEDASLRQSLTIEALRRLEII